MKVNIIIMSVALVLLFAWAWYAKGLGKAWEGIKSAGNMLSQIWLLLLIAIAVAGMIQVLIPKEIVSEYLGRGSGFKGIAWGWLIGSVISGAPYVCLPIGYSLLKVGAGIAPVMTLILSSMVVAITRVPYEIAFVGWKFALLRVLACLLVPPVGGLIVRYLNSTLGFY